jgi:hypothetical protein
MKGRIVIAAWVAACLGTLGYQDVISQVREASLTGAVTSEAQGSIEGVLVPGRYQLSIRATGFSRTT